MNTIKDYNDLCLKIDAVSLTSVFETVREKFHQFF